MGSRLGTLAGMVLLAGLIALVWVLTNGGSADEADGSAAPTDEVEPSDSTIPTTVPPSTASTTTTTSVPGPLYLNETPGPVLEAGIDGTLVGFGSRTMFRIDLATGEIDPIDLEWSLEIYEPGREVVVGDEIVAMARSGPASIVVTDLVTGAQRPLPDTGFSDTHWMWLAGQAGPDSVWLAAEVGPPAAVEVVEIDLAGEIRRRVDVPEGFWVQAARGDELHLEGPAGAWSYDTSTGTAVETAGRIMGPPWGSAVTMSCDETLQCQILVDTGAGPVPQSALTTADFWNGDVQISPDFTAALVQSYESFEGPELAHVDLATGSRVELGSVDVEPWFGLVWIPESPWVIGRNGMGRDPELIAFNTETGEQVEIDIPIRGLGNPESSHLLLAPDSPA